MAASSVLSANRDVLGTEAGSKNSGKSARSERPAQPPMLDSGKLVFVRYRDHLLLRNVDDLSQFQPSIRECVGWLLKENDQAVYLVWDRSVNPQRHERPNPEHSGLVILKSEILERREIE